MTNKTWYPVRGNSQTIKTMIFREGCNFKGVTCTMFLNSYNFIAYNPLQTVVLTCHTLTYKWFESYWCWNLLPIAMDLTPARCRHPWGHDMLPKPSLATALASANDFWAFSPREGLTAGVASRTLYSHSLKGKSLRCSSLTTRTTSSKVESLHSTFIP